MKITFYTENQAGSIIRAGVVDDYTSFFFTRSYAEAGEFQVTLPVTTYYRDLVLSSKYIKFGPKRAGIITKRGVTKANEQQVIIIRGIELKAITKARNINPGAGNEYYSVNVVPETAIAMLINSQLINAADANRQMNAEIAEYQTGTDLHKADYRYGNLYEEIVKIALLYNIGWYADIENQKIVFHITHGKDRTLEQSENARAILSTEMGTMLSLEYENDMFIPNTAVVLGQGQGASRESYTVNQDNSGTDRIEIAVDARDISEYALLEIRGMEKLNAYGDGNAYSIEASPSFIEEYGVNYDIGDIVTAIDEFIPSGSVNAQITSATEVYETGDIGLSLTLGYDENTYKGIIRRISDSTTSLINTDTVSPDTITALETSITQMNGMIQMKADKSVTDTLGTAIANNYTEFTQTANSFSLRIGQAEGAISNVQTDIDTLINFKNVQETYVWADLDGVHVEENTSGSGVLISPTRGVVLKDTTGTESAYVNASKLSIPNAEILNTMRIANVQFVPYTSGRLALKKVT